MYDFNFLSYSIDYFITVVLIFLPLPPSTEHPLLPQAIPTPLFMSMGHVYKFFGYSISYTVLYIPHGYSVTTYLYFLIPSPLHPLPHTLLPSGNHQNTLCIHDCVSVLRVCLICFLDLIVDRYVFFCHFIVHSFDILFFSKILFIYF